VARCAKTREPEALQRIQQAWSRDKMQRTTIADKQEGRQRLTTPPERPRFGTIAGGLRRGGGRTERPGPGCHPGGDRSQTEPRATRTRPNSLRTRACLRDYEAAKTTTAAAVAAPPPPPPPPPADEAAGFTSSTTHATPAAGRLLQYCRPRRPRDVSPCPESPYRKGGRLGGTCGAARPQGTTR
jgi:hypothetical protein